MTFSSPSGLSHCTVRAVCTMSEHRETKDTSIASLLAGFEVQFFCQRLVCLEIDSAICELDEDQYAASPTYSLESVQSIIEDSVR